MQYQLLIKFFLLSLIASANVLAGQATFSGTGRVESRPDYVQLMVTVKSECHPTPSEARGAADSEAARIFDFLKSNINENNDFDGVFSNGGYTQPFSKYVRKGNQSHQVCVDTFQKTTTITMKTSKIEEFSELFDGIQEFVFDNFTPQAKSNQSDSPLTYVTLGQPQPRLKQQIRSEREKEAIRLAVKDAKEKFEMTHDLCQITRTQIVRISEPGLPRPQPIAHYGKRMAMAADMAFAESSSPAPVEFDVHTVSKTLIVDFEFEGGWCD